MEHTCGIVVLRNDIRLIDNEAIVRAAQHCKKVALAWVEDSSQFAQTNYGWHKTGSFRAQFIIEALTDLRCLLRAQGSDLTILSGHPAKSVTALALELNATAVYIHKEATWEEEQVEESLERALWIHKIRLNTVWGATLYHLEDLPYPIKFLPDIFTAFRKDVERECRVRPALPAADPAVFIRSAALPPEAPIPTLAQLGLPTIEKSPLADYHVTGGQTAALAHLNAYLNESRSLSTYKETRNGLLGMEYSSKFSSWLALGSLSPRTIYEQVRNYEATFGANESTYWLIFELLWRDYFRFVARKYGRKLFAPSGIQGNVQTKPQPYTPTVFNKWVEGQTGIPFIDAAMRQLASTGFMSNRARQNVASFLVKDLKQDWYAGASYFESLLIDYDPCSNYGNWNYVAGIGNDPRENRYFNVLKQASVYDPKGGFVRHWLPQLGKLPNAYVHQPWSLPTHIADTEAFNLKRDYYLPIVNLRYTP
jgi:deoxyribodipyrimidine photo-lyase